MDIYEVKHYLDADNHQITSKTLIGDKDAVPFYEGTIGIPTPMGIMPFEFEFTPNTSLENCFAVFQETAEAAFTAAKEEHEKAKQAEGPKIWTPEDGAGNAIKFPKG